jgi:selenocysteine-specific elongation factor
MIVGTAGHIDHGKTTLVRALTGVDTDRLPEEKRRGITIELGFAPLMLDGLGTVGIVDVPGHEAFVRTMVAGATGIDAALVVVAADEGVMPQTREHLAILTLLGTRVGVVALTKVDLVDDEWIGLVRQDVAAALRGTSIEGAAVIETSAATGRGLPELRSALGAALASLPAREARGAFRMPVDRAFAVRGTGTVVTGTVWGGVLAPGASVVIQPGGETARVRGVQTHGAEVEEVVAGERAAVALAGIDVGQVPRGSWLVTDRAWPPTTVLRAVVALQEEAPTVRPREWVRFHLGTADVGARLVARGGPMEAGERRPVRIVLQEPVLARSGDRFVLRRTSPAETIGGGVIVDPLPPRRRAAPWDLARTTNDGLTRLLAEGGMAGVPVESVSIRLGSESWDSSLAVVVSGRLYSADMLDEVAVRIEKSVNDFHASDSLSTGTAVSALPGLLKLPVELVETQVTKLVTEGRLERSGAIVSRPGWRPVLSAGDQQLRSALLDALARAGQEPPDVPQLTATYHRDPIPILRIMEREGIVIAVESERYYATQSVQDLVARLREGMEPGREYGPAELREILGLSRKYLIPFLEFCDRKRYTERRTTGRVLLTS